MRRALSCILEESPFGYIFSTLDTYFNIETLAVVSICRITPALFLSLGGCLLLGFRTISVITKRSFLTSALLSPSPRRQSNERKLNLSMVRLAAVINCWNERYTYAGSATSVIACKVLTLTSMCLCVISTVMRHRGAVLIIVHRVENSGKLLATSRQRQNDVASISYFHKVGPDGQFKLRHRSRRS